MLRRLRRFLGTFLRTIVVVVIVLLLNVLGFLRWQVKRNPEYAINQAADAIRKHDGGKFETFVDVQKVAESYYDQHRYPVHVVNNVATPERRTHESAAIARRLRRWVETSRIDESEYPRLMLLGNALAGALSPKGRAQLSRIAVAGNLALGYINLEDPLRRKFDLELKLVRERSGWRITEVTNVEDLVNDLRREEERRIAAINDQVKSPAGVIKREKPLPLD